MNYLDLLGWLASHPFLSIIVLFVQYVFVMIIHHKAHNKYLHYVLGAWFIPQDIIVNFVLFTIIGMELPKEYLVTTRLARWKKITGYSRIDCWRHDVGWKLCDILNRWDEGHC